MSDNAATTICVVCICLLLAFGFKCCTDIQIANPYKHADQKEGEP